MMSLVQVYSQYIQCSADFSVTLQTETLSQGTSGFRKQIIIFKSYVLLWQYGAMPCDRGDVEHLKLKEILKSFNFMLYANTLLRWTDLWNIFRRR